MDIPKTRYWGKIVGFFFGFAVWGPFGAFIGTVLGHIYDTRRETGSAIWSDLWSGHHDFSAHIEQASFTMGVVVLSAKMAKSDGRVTRAEIDVFKSVFHISPTQEDAIGRLFNRARTSADGFEPYAFQLAHVFRGKPAVLEEILTGLFMIATADSSIGSAEVSFLKRVAYIFGFNGAAFVRIAARAGVRMGSKEKPPDQMQESFAILGIPDSATAEQIKSAYRALIREHHPDKLVAQGMPPEFVATATEKMKRINVAYDTVCKIKGIT